MAFENQLVEAQFRASEIWAASQNDPSKKPRINALAAVLSESTARIDNTYSDPDKKRTNRLFWINEDCSNAGPEARPGCDLDFGELGTSSKTYNLTRTDTKGYSVPYRDFETSVFNRVEVDAQGIISTERKLFNNLNTRVHEFLNDPVNLTNYTIVGGGAVDPLDNTIIVPSAQWTPRVLGLATRYAAQLGMADPYIISGNALYNILYDTKMDKGMEVNQGNAARVAEHRVYVDFTMDGTIGEEKFFLVDKGVLAFLNRLDWKNTTPISLDGASRLSWGKKSTILNTPIGVGVDGKPVSFMIDRSSQRKCKDGKDFADHNGSTLNADIVRMPDLDCTDNAVVNGGTFVDKYTGILAFKCA